MWSVLGRVSFLILIFDLANLENLLHMKSGRKYFLTKFLGFHYLRINCHNTKWNFTERTITTECWAIFNSIFPQSVSKTVSV